MLDTMLRGIVRTGKEHRRLKPLALHTLLLLFCGVSLAERAVNRLARIGRAGGREDSPEQRRPGLKTYRGGRKAFRPSYRPAARLAAAALSVCMSVTAVPFPVFAVEGEAGLCGHHPAHTAECGYRETVPCHACEHGHTQACYLEEPSCGYDEAAGETVSGSDAGHTHDQGCYELACAHERGEHDGGCGYLEAVEGAACGYVCDLCAGAGQSQDSGGESAGGTGLPAPGESVSGNGLPIPEGGVSGNGLPIPEGTVSGNSLPAPEGAETITITAVDALDDTVQYQAVPAGTKRESLALPAALGASGFAAASGMEPAPEPEAVTIEGVSWKPDHAWDGTAGEGGYTFTPKLPEGYTLAEGVNPPEIYVMAGMRPMLFSAGPDDANDDGYHDGDVAVVNAVIEDNGLNAEKDAPAGWTFATWNNETPKRITELVLAQKGLRDTLDVTGLTKLTKLYCRGNYLDTLDVSGLTGLTSLDCGGNQLGTLDVRGLTGLTYLNCETNQMRTLNVTGLTGLSGLNCDSNELGTLDVRGLTGLTNLTCNGNELGTLDVRGLTSLTALDCRRNQLRTLNVSGLMSLTTLHCEANQLGTLDVGGLTGLTSLSCQNNQLSTLDVSGLTSLTNLTCSNNQLSTLDVSGLASLTDLSCSNNQLSTLNVSGLTSLTSLYCDNNQLETLDVSGLTGLTSLYCPNNQLRTLDVSGLAGLADGLYCANNPLASLKLPEGRELAVNSAEGGAVRLTGYDGDIKSVTLQAIPDSGRTFQGWTAAGTSLAQTNANPVTFTLNGAVTITPVFESPEADQSGGGGALEKDDSHSDSSGKSGNTGVQAQAPAGPDIPAIGTTPALTPDQDGSVTVEDDAVSAAISAAKQAGQQKDGAESGIAVSVPVDTIDGQSVLTITVPASALDQLVGEQVSRLELTTSDMVSFRFSKDILKELDAGSAGGPIVLRAERRRELSGEAGEAVGSRPVYDITMSYLVNGREVPVSAWNGKAITIKLPYTPKEGEDAGNLCAVYVDDAGTVHWLTHSTYDPDQKAVLLQASHLSVYGVGFRSAPAFSDTAGHWAKTEIDFAVNRGLLTGVGEAVFAPEEALTRGVFVTALGRLSGIDPAAYPPSGRFSDVSADASYAPYAEWAVQKSIAKETGEGLFSPDTPVTREQMAVMLTNYAGQMGYSIPAPLAAVTFADSDKISAWAAKEVVAMQRAGIIKGKDENRFDPQASATRAEGSAALRRFVEIVIDPATAQGWTRNDAGRSLYYEDGKPVTGWKQLEGSWYYFDAAGLMEYGGWKQIEGVWYYFCPDGAVALHTKTEDYDIVPEGAGEEKE